jgi:hypothetical protein
MLKVSDPNGAYSEDTIDVTVTNEGFNAIANAGGNKTVDEYSAVTLNGSGSDPNDDPIHFTWTQFDGPWVALTGANTAAFVSAAGAQLKFQLLVWDDFGGWGFARRPSQSPTLMTRQISVTRMPTWRCSGDTAIDAIISPAKTRCSYALNARAAVTDASIGSTSPLQTSRAARLAR